MGPFLMVGDYMARSVRRTQIMRPYRQEYERNRKKILQSQDTCCICGRPVDKTLKAPEPYSATVDHIVPINKGGHPCDIQNLQLAHWICNRLKSDRVPDVSRMETPKQKLYQTRDWMNF